MPVQSPTCSSDKLLRIEFHVHCRRWQSLPQLVLAGKLQARDCSPDSAEPSRTHGRMLPDTAAVQPVAAIIVTMMLV